MVSHELQGGILGSSIGDAAQKENEQWLGKIKTLRVARLHPIFFFHLTPFGLCQGCCIRISERPGSPNASVCMCKVKGGD